MAPHSSEKILKIFVSTWGENVGKYRLYFNFDAKIKAGCLNSFIYSPKLHNFIVHPFSELWLISPDSESVIKILKIIPIMHFMGNVPDHLRKLTCLACF